MRVVTLLAAVAAGAGLLPAVAQETPTPAAPPPRVTVVTAGSQVMLNVEGMRMRMLFAAVIVGVVESSVTVRTPASVQVGT